MTLALGIVSAVLSLAAFLSTIVPQIRESRGRRSFERAQRAALLVRELESLKAAGMDVGFDSESSTQMHEALIRSLQQVVRLGSLEFSELENHELPVPIASLLTLAYGLLISVVGGSYAQQNVGKSTASWITGLVVLIIGAIVAFVGLITFVVLIVRNIRTRALRERAGMKAPGLLETIKSNWHLLRNLAIRRKLRRRRD